MNLEMRDGVVTQVSPTLKVAVAPSTIGTVCKKFDSYATPAVNDRVKVLVNGGDRIVIGRITP